MVVLSEMICCNHYSGIFLGLYCRWCYWPKDDGHDRGGLVKGGDPDAQHGAHQRPHRGREQLRTLQVHLSQNDVRAWSSHLVELLWRLTCRCSWLLLGDELAWDLPELSMWGDELIVAIVLCYDVCLSRWRFSQCSTSLNVSNMSLKQWEATGCSRISDKGCGHHGACARKQEVTHS